MPPSHYRATQRAPLDERPYRLINQHAFFVRPSGDLISPTIDINLKFFFGAGDGSNRILRRTTKTVMLVLGALNDDSRLHVRPLRVQRAIKPSFSLDDVLVRNTT
jgi:hypothetical protein